MAININLIDQLLAEHGHRPEDIGGENGLLKQLTKALVERAMQAEMTSHLGYEKHDPAGYKRGNSRNGKSHKKVTGEFGEIDAVQRSPCAERFGGVCGERRGGECEKCERICKMAKHGRAGTPKRHEAQR